MKFLLLTYIIFSVSIFAQSGKSVHQLEWEYYEQFPKEKSLFDSSGKGIIPLNKQVSKALTGKIFGYLPYWQYPSRNYIKYQLITHLAVFSFGVSVTGSLSNPSYWPWTDVIDSTHANGVKAIACVTNFNGTQIHTILTDTTVKNTFFLNLKNLLIAFQFDGANIDFEGVNTADRGTVLNTFMADLRTYLQSFIPGCEVSFAAPAVNWGGWNLPGLAAACDYLFIMGYDFYGSWSTLTGPSAPLTGGTYNITNTVNTQYAGINTGKLILGMPFYGCKWKTTTDASHAPVISFVSNPRFSTGEEESQIYGKQWAADNQVTWYKWYDTVWNQVWIDGDSSIQLKINLAKSKNYLGVGMWALTYDGSRNELWDIIRDNFSVPVPKKFVKVWQRSANGAGTSSFPSWFSTTGNTERGLAYGVINGNERLYVVSRNGVNSIRILNANTGVDIDTLKTSGISGGTFAINDVEVSSDGKIFVCNLTTSASSSAFKVYRWDTETSVPVNVITYNSAAYRLGDKFTVIGSTEDSSAVIYAAAANSNKLLKWTMSGGSFVPVPQEIVLSNTTNVGINPSVAPKSKGVSGFFFNANSVTPSDYSSSGIFAGSINSSVVPLSGNAIRYISLGAKKYITTYLNGTGNEKAILVDVSGGASSVTAADVYGTTPVLGTNANTNGAGDIAYKLNNDGTVTIFLLGTNNGIAAFRTVTPLPYILELNLTALLEGFMNEADSFMTSGDTIKVFLNNSSAPYNSIDSAAVYLNSDGGGYAIFPNTSKGNYYLSLKHRNHLETWSSSPVSFADYFVNYDFTDSSATAYGNNLKLKGNKWCLYAGDANKDGQITLDDLIQIDYDNQNFSAGYIPSDINGDGQVTLDDLIITDTNNQNFISVQKP